MLKKIIYIINIALSLSYLPFFWFKKKKDKKNIWLFGAGNGQYENNIACFHEYVLNNIDIKNNEIYFITIDNSLISDKFDFKCLIRGKARTYALSFIADYLIFDTCNSDISPGIHNYLKGLKINVNHGFEGLKKLPSDYYVNIDADIHCASSDKEKNIKVALCGADSNKVYVTGYPRFDKIAPHKNESIRNILFFPTWRSWLESVPVNEIEQSQYVRSVRDFLFDKKLRKYLIDNNIVLYYKPHHKLKYLKFDDACCNNIKFLGPSDDLSLFIREADLLITDYSSVAWDFLYNNRKVLFFIFDMEEYIKYQGLYYDVRTSKSHGYSLTGTGMRELVIQSCTEIKFYHSDMAEDFFKYRDTENCYRLLNLILESRS
ncbi:TPA: CDP-glycerol glycerophosphotransferase family protein [Citrobacter amalonaticus]